MASRQRVPLLALMLSILVVFLIQGPVFIDCDFPEPNSNNNERDAIAFLEEYDRNASIVFSYSAFKAWDYATNLTDYNQQQSVAADLVVADFLKRMRGYALEFDQSGFSASTVRQLSSILTIGSAALDDATEIEELSNLISGMESRYAKGEVCAGSQECYSLEPELTRIMSTSRDPDELLWAWRSWRDAVGAPARDDYIRYVELKNKAALANSYPDAGAYWRSYYEVDNLQEIAEKLFEELQPLYLNLHAFVRRKLFETYGFEQIDLSGPIPAHLLGNMWAQTWSNIYPLVEPYPDETAVDITPELVRQNYTALRMFQVSDEFFKSLGLFEMPPAFWEHSMIEKPDDGRDVICHASAWDFSNGVDYRIKQCTDITMDDFITVHHEMGHIQYDLQYSDQPILFQGGANPGFHEAVGDVLALSVATPKHLVTVGLLPSADENPQADLNFLMSMALDKIAFLPFGYLMDQWRWGIFDGSTPPERFNAEWWTLRNRFQGVAPPVDRSEADFDPGAKFHIPADVPYIRYFMSFVLQFQFQGALCEAAGHEGSLHTCDIYRSKAAGDKLANMLMKGSSEPWPDALEAITGSREISAESIIDYFKPLITYLEQENERNGDVPGWPGMFTPAQTTEEPERTTRPQGGGTSAISPIPHLVGLFIFLIFAIM